MLDLMYGDDLDKLSERKGPRLWERQMNRSRLKASLLKKWGEEYIDRRESKLDIVISEEMKDIMEKDGFYFGMWSRLLKMQRLPEINLLILRMGIIWPERLLRM